MKKICLLPIALCNKKEFFFYRTLLSVWNDYSNKKYQEHIFLRSFEKNILTLELMSFRIIPLLFSQKGIIRNDIMHLLLEKGFPIVINDIVIQLIEKKKNDTLIRLFKSTTKKL